MKSNRMLIVVVALVGLVAVMLAAIALLIPDANPAFATAIDFVNAAGTGDDEAAMRRLSPALQAYVAENCPDGRVSACVDAYSPGEWGAFRSAVYRRSLTDGPRAHDIDLIGTYESGVGASGVCVYVRVEQAADDEWYVTGWAGFIHCGDPESRNMATNPDTPNRAP